MSIALEFKSECYQQLREFTGMVQGRGKNILLITRKDGTRFKSSGYHNAVKRLRSKLEKAKAKN